MTKTYRDQGVIIKVKQFPGADKLVVLLTRRHGIVESVAKGVSKSSSKNVSSIDLLNHVKVSFYRTKSLDLLREVEVVNDYQTLKSDSEISKNLLYVLELIDKINTSTGQELKGYNLLFDFLESGVRYPLQFQQLLTCFEIKLLETAGFTPNLETYIKDGGLIQRDQKRILSSGQLLGYQEVGTNSKHKVISDRVVKTQRFLLEKGFTSCLKLQMDSDLLKELQFINRYWIENIIEKRLKSSSLLTS